MPIRASQYFERIRSGRNFLASLFLGIVAGGIVGVLVQELFRCLQIMVEIRWLYILLIAFFAGISYSAFLVSGKTEKIVVPLATYIDPNSLRSLCNSALKQAKALQQSPPGLIDLIEAINSVLGDERGLESANLPTLQRYMEEIREVRPKVKDKSIGKTVELIEDSLSTIERLHDLLIKKAVANRNAFSDSGYYVERSERGLFIKKRRLLRARRVMTVEFDSNIRRSLHRVEFCTVSIHPVSDYSEYRSLLTCLRRFLRLMNSERSFQKIGMKLQLEEQEEFWSRVKKELYQPLVEYFETTAREIVAEIEEIYRPRESEE